MKFLIDINECDFTPCDNNGTCINSEGSYSCNCTDGWTDKNCNEGTHKKLVLNFTLSVGWYSPRSCINWLEKYLRIVWCFVKQISMNVMLTVPVRIMLHVSTIMDPMFVTAQMDGKDMIAKMVMINIIM